MRIAENESVRRVSWRTAVRWFLVAVLVAQVLAGSAMIVISMALYVQAWHLSSWALWAGVGLAAAAAIYGLCRGLPYAARHRFQFSLRVLLLVTAAVALSLGTLGQWLLDSWRLQQLRVQGVQWDRPGDFLMNLTAWQSVDVRSDVGLRLLVAHPKPVSKAEQLLLLGPAVTDRIADSADELARFTRLRSVSLRNAAVTGRALQLLSKCQRLEILRI